MYKPCPKGRLKTEGRPSGARNTVASNLEADRRSTHTKPSGGSADGLPEKINLETTMSGDKAPKSDEESKGLFSSLFSQGRNLFTSSQRGEGEASSAETTEEAVRADATRENLARAATQFIETIIRLRLKDVDDFDESKGANYGDLMIDVLNKSLMVRAELEKREDEEETHIQQLEFHIQSIEV